MRLILWKGADAMSGYLNSAREHAEEIAYYANYGAPGHAHHQAGYHWRCLQELLRRAVLSQRQAADVPAIQLLMQGAADDMQSAKARDAGAEDRL